MEIIMKIINFGSLNIDKIYHVKEFVMAGQTIKASSYQTASGGKGFNQSLSAAKAGADVLHAGFIGQDGQFLKKELEDSHVNVDMLETVDLPTGHAIIEVNAEGQNRIIIHGGSNLCFDISYIKRVLDQCTANDFVLLQNETNCTAEIIHSAHQKGMQVVFNPSPMPEDLSLLPLSDVDCFIVNEVEGFQLAEALGLHPSEKEHDHILSVLAENYPEKDIIMTLGEEGVLYQKGSLKHHMKAFPVNVIDTTAAGDTFTGYFLSAVCKGKEIYTALQEASAASAIAVSRMGAGPSIPSYCEVKAFLRERIPQ